MPAEIHQGATAVLVPEYRGLLPSAVLQELDPDSRRPVSRTARDWMVDLLCFVLTCALAASIASTVGGEDIPRALARADIAIGAVSCLTVWWRRSRPFELALLLVPVGLISTTSGAAALVMCFSLAVHRPLRYVVWVVVPSVAAAPLLYLYREDPELPYLASVALSALLTVGVVGWGMFVRSRRQLVVSLRDRASRAETETELRAQQAQRLAREAIAREMHDVLAHRLTLLSVHAGALEFRPDAPREEIGRAAGVIRESAHEALQDLRGIIGVLRAAEPEESGRPQPTLAAVSTLVDEAREAGADIEFMDTVREPDAAPALLGRTAYRIVQEALTNTRKHAPGAHVVVRVEGGQGGELTVVVRNEAPVGPVPEVPGSGQGLIGLTERAHLAGGTLSHGPLPGGGWSVAARLPWAA